MLRLNALPSVLAALSLLFLAGCGSVDPTAAVPTSAPAPTTAPAPTAVPVIGDPLALYTFSSAAGTVGQVTVPGPHDATTWIAYVETLDRAGGQYDLWLMRPDGSERRQLTSEPGMETSPAWSPDGTTVVFNGTAASTNPADCATGLVELRCNFDIYAVDVASGVVSRLTDSPNFDREPSWSPDGSRIVYTTRETRNPYAQIAVMPALGGEPTILAAGEHYYYGPTFSPDGGSIAFARSVGSHQAFEICVMDADGANVRCLTDPADIAMHPSWSPDGAELVFVRQKPGANPGLGDLMIMDSDGGNQRVYPTMVSPLLGYTPSWSPDGQYLTYTGNAGSGRTVTIVSRDEVYQAAAMSPQSLTAPAWSPTFP